jgi:hypothetical protein
MLKTIALIGVGTAIAFAPLPTIAQTYQSAAPAVSAPAAAAPTGVAQKPDATPCQLEQGKG